MKMNELTIDMECWIILEGTYNIDLSTYLEFQKLFSFEDWNLNYMEFLQQTLGEYIENKINKGEKQC